MPWLCSLWSTMNTTNTLVWGNNSNGPRTRNRHQHHLLPLQHLQGNASTPTMPLLLRLQKQMCGIVWPMQKPALWQNGFLHSQTWIWRLWIKQLVGTIQCRCQIKRKSLSLTVFLLLQLSLILKWMIAKITDTDFWLRWWIPTKPTHWNT